MERWAIHPESGLMISDSGRVRTLSGVFIKLHVDEKGYVKVSYTGRWWWVHRLVCETFRPTQRMKSLVVDHLNSDRSDNRIENLEFVTHRENSIRTGQRGRYPRTKGRTPIIAINLETGERSQFDSQAHAERVLGISNKNINHCLKGERKTSHGFRFIYVKEAAS